MDSNEQPEQTLYRQKQEKLLSPSKRYILSDNAGLYITFETAQEAFAWIELYTPAAITHVKIEQ